MVGQSVKQPVAASWTVGGAVIEIGDATSEIEAAFTGSDPTQKPSDPVSTIDRISTSRKLLFKI